MEKKGHTKTVLCKRIGKLQFEMRLCVHEGKNGWKNEFRVLNGNWKRQEKWKQRRERKKRQVIMNKSSDFNLHHHHRAHTTMHLIGFYMLYIFVCRLWVRGAHHRCAHKPNKNCVCTFDQLSGCLLSAFEKKRQQQQDYTEKSAQTE